MKDIYTYLSPFLAGLIASVITYFFTMRAKNLVNRGDAKYVYEQLLFQIEECIDRMYKDLKLPA